MDSKVYKFLIIQVIFLSSSLFLTEKGSIINANVFDNPDSLTWTQLGSDIDGEAESDWSGYSVSLSADGTVVAIGASGNDGTGDEAGHIRVYKNISGTWTQVGDDIDGEAAWDYSGTSISLSADGTVVAIGASGNDANGYDAGHVRVYKNISGIWTQVGDDIDGEGEYDWSGYSVSLSGDGTVVAIGGPGNNGNGYDAGHVRVYKNISGTWSQVGDDIDGEAEYDYSGILVSLSVDGTVVAIGASGNDGNGEDAGHVRVFKNISDTWTQVGDDIDGEAEHNWSGYSLSLSAAGTMIAIGASGNDGSGYEAGHVRIYKNISGTWTQVGDDIDGEAEYDYSGTLVSLSADGTVVAIGASGNDGSGDNAGHVRVYKNISGTWTQVGGDIDGEAEYDWSGYAVSLSDDGTVVAVGGPGNDGKSYDAGNVRVFSLRSKRSAVIYLDGFFYVIPIK